MTSEPSANWVMLMPDHTLVELSRGQAGGQGGQGGGSSGSGESNLGTANTDVTNLTTVSPDQVSTGNEDSPFLQTSLNASGNALNVAIGQ